MTHRDRQQTHLEKERDKREKERERGEEKQYTENNKHTIVANSFKTQYCQVVIRATSSTQIRGRRQNKTTRWHHGSVLTFQHCFD